MNRELRLFYERQIKEYALLKRQYARQQQVIETLLQKDFDSFIREAVLDFIRNDKDE
jgi:hypothetical protein